MKGHRIPRLILICSIGAALITNCTKDEPSVSNSLSGQQVKQVQNLDLQDAVADKVDQDADNSIDELQAQNYQVPLAKSALTSGSITITVDHPDSTFFPKIVTIIYSDYQSGNSDETFIRNGEINVVINAQANKQLITRNYTFKNFSVTTDSTRVTVKGTRLVARTAQKLKYNGLQSLRIINTDQITSDLRFSIVRTDDTDTLKFTRAASKVRTAYLHFDNIGGNTWKTIKFRNNPAKDTLIYSGTVTGINEKGDSYSKTIKATDPLTVIFYEGVPVMISGTIDYSVTGASAASFTITYKQDSSHPRMTLVTVTNNATQATHSFDRRIGRKHLRWW
jgi:hypothetical protein